MRKLQWIALLSIVAARSVARSQSPQLNSQQATVTDNSNSATAPANRRELKLSEKAFQATELAIDEAAALSRQAGNENEAIQWQRRKGRTVTIGDIRALLDVMDRFRDKSELLSAQKLYVRLQIVSDSLKEDFPAIAVLIQLHLNYLDDEFERYDTALHRIDEIESMCGKFGNCKPRKFYPAREHLLRELGQYDKAEEYGLKYLEETAKDSVERSKGSVPSAKFELRAIYADTGEFQKLADLGAAQSSEFYNADGSVDPSQILLLISSAVKYHLSGDKNLDEADRKCQDLVERMKFYKGVSSRSYIEAIELMSKVKIAKSNYPEALDLLRKSSDLRAGLFGSDHPSVARTQAEIERVRKLSLSVADVRP